MDYVPLNHSRPHPLLVYAVVVVLVVAAAAVALAAVAVIQLEHYMLCCVQLVAPH